MASFCAVFILLISTISSSVLANSQYGRHPTKPGKSCRDIYQMNPASHDVSGYYIIVTDRPHFVYCNMSLECGGEKGWMRIADVNPAKNDCPSAWKKITSPVAACRPPSDNAGCFPTFFSTHKAPYSRVCGMVIGIQKATTDAFVSGRGTTSIDRPYLDGVSITFGYPRKHIWSYASSITEDDFVHEGWDISACPCSKHENAAHPLPFVRDHYYCESGTTRAGSDIYINDPLWDGKGCSVENLCCTDPDMPWFFRQLPLTHDENIEARICYNQPYNDESVFVKEARFYVQ